jgi:hypothetical protein
MPFAHGNLLFSRRHRRRGNKWGAGCNCTKAPRARSCGNGRRPARFEYRAGVQAGSRGSGARAQFAELKEQSALSFGIGGDCTQPQLLPSRTTLPKFAVCQSAPQAACDQRGRRRPPRVPRTTMHLLRQHSIHVPAARAASGLKEPEAGSVRRCLPRALHRRSAATCFS